MIRIDEQLTQAPVDTVFRVAADVEQWPEILPHYRWVRFEAREAFGTGVVEMAAFRDFGGPLRWPTWWKSEMAVDEAEPVVRYHHIDGVTRGMDVVWEFHRTPDGTLARIVHEWDGPPWPLIRSIAADWVIGPHFVSAIAKRTLAGVCAEAERRARQEGAGSHA